MRESLLKVKVVVCNRYVAGGLYGLWPDYAIYLYSDHLLEELRSLGLSHVDCINENIAREGEGQFVTLTFEPEVSVVDVGCLLSRYGFDVQGWVGSLRDPKVGLATRVSGIVNISSLDPQ